MIYSKTLSTLPTVHLNGTSADELIEQRTTAAAAISAAIKALGEAYPHPRDFPQGSPSGGWREARELHLQRIAMLDGLHREICAEAVALCDARDEYAARRGGAR